MKRIRGFLSRLLIVGLAICLLAVPNIVNAGQSDARGKDLRAKGEDALRVGDYGQAISSLQKASITFAQQGDPAAQTDALVRLAEIYQRQGVLEEAVKILEEALSLARSLNDARKIAGILNVLALWSAQSDQDILAEHGSMVQRGIVDTLVQSNDVQDSAIRYLDEAYNLASTQNDERLLSTILNNHGIISALRDDFLAAKKYFKMSIALAEELNELDLIAAASINYASMTIKYGEIQQAEMYVKRAGTLYRGMAGTHKATRGMLKVGQLYRTLAEKTPDLAPRYREQATAAFLEVSAAANQFRDKRMVSYALGYLGQMYEEQKELSQALHMTRRALFVAQQINALELLAIWKWQIGRILHQQGDTENAITAYRQASTNIQSIQQSLESSCLAGSLSYKETVEPIYKELTNLLLQKASAEKSQHEMESILLEARQTVETLKFAELQDYFRNFCLEEVPQKSKIAKNLLDNTAIIYMICLPEQVELLLTLPEGIRRVTIPSPGNALLRDVRMFRRALQDLSTDEYLVYAKKLYDTLFRPLEVDLNHSHINMLIFIPDDAFRSIPLAALHDGTKFLINKYAIATSLGMKFTVPRPRPDTHISMLAAGLSESVHNYPALPYVAKEISAIKKLFEGDLLLNQEFSVAKFREKVEQKKYSILHLATHGEFVGDVRKSSLLAWDGKLTLDQFGRLVKVTRYKDEPLDLITLSACNTALGDDRALLGLAGVAIQSGALSSLATLWGVDDKTTSELMTDFYRQLKTTSLTKAQALQNAQIAVQQQHRHPFFWSPFILIGNWH